MFRRTNLRKTENDVWFLQFLLFYLKEAVFELEKFYLTNILSEIHERPQGACGRAPTPSQLGFSFVHCRKPPHRHAEPVSSIWYIFSKTAKEELPLECPSSEICDVSFPL
jgi:hypothetical protein